MIQRYRLMLEESFSHCHVETQTWLPISNLIEEARVALCRAHKAADVLVGIATLSNPDYLVEVDTIAVVDQPCRSTAAGKTLLTGVRCSIAITSASGTST
jgi:hypothetical protein